jgi:hypothetical protein
MCRHEEIRSFANMIQDIPLSLADRFQFCQAPVNINKVDVATAVRKVLSLSLAVCLSWRLASVCSARIIQVFIAAIVVVVAGS